VNQVAPIFKPKLPSLGNKDKDQIVDSAGNIYEFNSEQEEWIYKGIVPDPDLVGFSVDGLVSPDVFRKLSLIQELIERGFDFSNFKLNSDVSNPYYYLFHSSDDLIRFIPEKNVVPRKVVVSGSITDLVLSQGITTIGVSGANFTSDLSGLVLEVDFNKYVVLSNTSNTIKLAGETSLKVGDSFKVVSPELIKTQLRIEVDRSKLYQKLVRNCCVGPKGKQGLQGDKGTNGIPADNEKFQLPISTTDGAFVWINLECERYCIWIDSGHDFSRQPSGDQEKISAEIRFLWTIILNSRGRIFFPV